jgi:hypothetical protein
MQLICSKYFHPQLADSIDSNTQLKRNEGIITLTLQVK